MWGHMNEWDSIGSGMGFGTMGLGMLVFWVLVAFGFAVLVRYATGNGGKEEQHALELLKERYARGEIGREEYEQKKHDLEQ